MAIWPRDRVMSLVRNSLIEWLECVGLLHFHMISTTESENTESFGVPASIYLAFLSSIVYLGLQFL